MHEMQMVWKVLMEALRVYVVREGCVE